MQFVSTSNFQVFALFNILNESGIFVNLKTYLFVAMSEEISFASEFSGDDEDFDVTYTPSQESKKRKVFNGDGEQFVKRRMETTFGNIIFTSNFYIEVKKV